MNTKEAYQVLGLCDGASRSEVRIAYRKKQKRMEKLVGIASTAISKQVGLQELKQLDESRSLLMPRSGFRNKSNSKYARIANFKTYLSTTTSVLVVATIALSLTTGKVAGVWGRNDTIERSQTSEVAQAVVAGRMESESLREKYESLIETQHLDRAQVVVAANDQFLQAVTQEQQGALSGAVASYQDVISQYQSVLEQLGGAINSRQLSVAAEKHLIDTLKSKNITALTQFDALHDQMRSAEKQLKTGLYEKAGREFRELSKRFEASASGLQAAINAQQNAQLAMQKWHQFRDKNALESENTAAVEQPYMLAEEQLRQGQFELATQSFESAASGYETALIDGPKFLYEKQWLTKMRKRIAEIESEKTQSEAALEQPSKPASDQSSNQQYVAKQKSIIIEQVTEETRVKAAQKSIDPTASELAENSVTGQTP